MKNNITLLIIIFVFILLIGGSYVLYNYLSPNISSDKITTNEESQKENDASQQEKESAPDFTVYDKNDKEVNLSDFRGKPTIVNFWASWCGPCKMEMPDFEEKYRALGNEINFLMVNMTDGSRETVKIASNFIKKEDYTFPVYFDTKSDAAIAYSVYSLPTTYFIDSDGYVVAQSTGAINSETLQKGIDMIKEEN
ncbi:MAG: TlpA family protein disulfide reductase [Eubacterium sp.]|nr:TlpA family protein disulfide reductase [Eubacterium sp.]